MLKKPLKVLPNTFNPHYSPQQLVRTLSRLPLKSLLNLAELWTTLPQTQPPATKPASRATQHDRSTAVFTTLEQMKKTSVRKRKVIDTIVSEFWHTGLNLLQLASIDCQLLVDQGNAYSWSYSTVYNRKEGANRSVQIVSFNSQRFLELLIQNLSSFYYNHVYVCRHPTLPLTIVRIQVFDLLARVSLKKNTRQPNLTSYRAFFVVIPINTPHVIHSPLSSASDLTTTIIIQALEGALSDSMGHAVRLDPAEGAQVLPVKSLEAIFLSLGNSRFGSCLGMWIPYADNTVDMNPLDTTDKHPSLLSEPPSTLTKRQTMANVRFRGTETGTIVSEQLYEGSRRKRQRQQPERSHAGTLTGAEEGAENQESSVADNQQVAVNDETAVGEASHPATDPFRSLAPVQNIEFRLVDPPGQGNGSRKPAGQTEPIGIRLRLTGRDVFAGLHEMCANEAGPVDPFKIPPWLTGEGGGKNGVIRAGQWTAYTPSDSRGGGLI